jgi:triosephosphate isomerase
MSSLSFASHSLWEKGMRQMMVAGNWKMHGSLAKTVNILSDLRANCDIISNAELVVLPPFVFLAEAQRLLSGSKIALGAQNMHEQDSGAFTGEIAGTMLKEFTCRYVLLGHSERRNLFGETDEQVAKKFRTALQCGLNPILCIGENLSQREQAQTKDVVLAQLSAVVDVVGIQALAGTVLAYEPVWAIGTGKTATPEQAQEVHLWLREFLVQCDKTVGQAIRILYGGSVKPDNAAALFAMPDIDGGLIGGASLDAKAFLDIAQCSNSYC